MTIIVWKHNPRFLISVFFSFFPFSPSRRDFGGATRRVERVGRARAFGYAPRRRCTYRIFTPGHNFTDEPKFDRFRRERSPRTIDMRSVYGKEEKKQKRAEPSPQPISGRTDIIIQTS